MVKKVIQVPVEAKLLYDLNKISKKQKKSRSEFIREACAHYLAEIDEAEAERRYIESYTKYPENPEMGELGIQMLSEILPDEEW